MNKHKVQVNWLENMAFEAKVNEHKIILDADAANGGEDRGPRPKPFMLTALAGCTGMDVISILKKMRVEVEAFHVSVEGELTDEYPKYYKSMHVIYSFKGKNLPIDKLHKAINLSEESYCGVSAIYKQVIKITSEIKIE